MYTLGGYFINSSERLQDTSQEQIYFFYIIIWKYI